MTTALNIHILCESNRLFYYSNLHDCISATPYNNLILLLEKYYFGIQKKKSWFGRHWFEEKKMPWDFFAGWIWGMAYCSGLQK